MFTRIYFRYPVVVVFSCTRYFFIIIGIGPFVFYFGLLSCAALRQRLHSPSPLTTHRGLRSNTSRGTLDDKHTDRVHNTYSIPRRRRRKIYSRVYYYCFSEICFILLSYTYTRIPSAYIDTYGGVQCARYNVKRYCCIRRVSSLGPKTNAAKTTTAH